MAITFGNNGDNGTQGTTSFSANNNGDFLIVFCQGTTAPTGVTYNGVSLTQIGTNQTHTNFGRTVNMWGLANPAAGANTLAVSGSANVDVGWTSITGYGSNSGFAKTDVTSSNPSLSVTTTIDNAYVVGCFFGNYSSVGSNTTNVRQIVESAFQLIRSTNAVTPAGSFTLNINASSSSEAVLMAVGINPFVSTAKFSNPMLLMGVGN